MSPKYVYFFGAGKAEGNAKMQNLLGGKGANLAEMTNIGIPVPAGFTITTEVCTSYYKSNKKYPEELKGQVLKALPRLEKIMEMKFGDPQNPLLVSVRSGARRSMPGMMETVLNVGLTSKTMPGLIVKTQNPRFVWDAYRRLIMMYADVVMEKAAGIEPKDDRGIRMQLDEIMNEMKKKKGLKNDTEMTVGNLRYLCDAFKRRVKEVLGKDFPDDPMEQLWGGIAAVFQSWMGRRAVSYRRIENLSDDWGTAVSVQAMVFGNMGNTSATGVAFTRNPATGDRAFFGEWLQNAQGEDVVAGIRTPYALNERAKSEQNKVFPSLEKAMPRIYRELVAIRKKLEHHYRDMQDIEFTIQDGRLWMLQTRVGKRTGPAALKMAVDMTREGLIDKATAIMRVRPEQLEELLHPMIDPVAEMRHKPLAKGLPAGPGGGVGKIVFSADRAEEMAKAGEKVILVRNETSPEDVHGMHGSQAILTAKGGMTSHAALVARGWGKCCIVGCGELIIDYHNRQMTVKERVLKEGDIITLNGTKGYVYEGSLPLVKIDPTKNKELRIFLKTCDELARLQVWTNADTPNDAAQARTFGAKGIGLTRTEHMFFAPERIRAMREMIVAETEETRRSAIMKLLPFQKNDFIGILKAMKGLPVTIRFLDPPLHEFLPQEPNLVRELAGELGITVEKLEGRIKQLHELNPMLGLRGCRLGIIFPEITEMQTRAVLEAAAELTKQKIKVYPEIMIPLVGHLNELKNQKALIMKVAEDVKKAYNLKALHFRVGTMIEVPRAAITADEIAKEAEFFSFGTNDLTQMGCGFSRDDAGSFLPGYVNMGIYSKDPFQSLDQEGVGKMVAIGVERGRKMRPNLKIGICGEHGGDPDSIDFCHRVGLDYVSCSPYRVPIARLAAAQAAIRNGSSAAKQKTKSKRKKSK